MSRKNSGAKKLAPTPNWPPSTILDSGRKFRLVVAVDLHETTLRFWGNFGPWLEKQYVGLKFDPETLATYHPAGDPKVGIGYVEFWRALEKYVELGVGGYGSFQALPGALAALKRVKKAGIGIEFLTYVPGTSDLTRADKLPINTGVARRVTVELLEKLGFPVDWRDVTFISPFKKVYHMIDHQIPLLVEDNRTTASHVADHGLAAILVPTSYNQGVMPNVLRIADYKDKAMIWQETGERIIQFYLELARRQMVVLEGGH